MHGWAGDARCWEPWIAATAPLGWLWQCGERGYGLRVPVEPAWPADAGAAARRLFIGYSLGLHLTPATVLAQADAVVLVSSFAAFVPAGRPGRRVRAALEAMAGKLGGEETARQMLREFSANAAAPYPPDPCQSWPAEGPLHLDRLKDDLATLGETSGLPAGFPAGARTLILEATGDRIVDPAARGLLRELLPGAEVIRLEGAGHALPGAEVAREVAAWVEAGF